NRHNHTGESGSGARNNRPTGAKQTCHSHPKGDGGEAYQLPDGRWRAEVDLGRGADGKRRRVAVYGKTAAAANAARRDAVRRKEDGLLASTRSPTLIDWLEYWLTNIAAVKLKPRTLVGYRSYIRTWVVGTKVAKVRLDKLTPEHLEQLYGAMREAKRSESTVSQLHRILSRSMTVAVQRGRLGANPAKKLEAPQPAAFDPHLLTPDDARKLRVVAERTEGGTRWLVALALGLRQGEALALAWDKVDLDTGVLHVHRELYSLSWQHGCPESEPCGRHAFKCPERHGGGRFVGTPKSAAGRRTLPLPPQLLSALRRHKETQARIRIEEGKHWTGFKPQNGDKLDLVFSQRDGKAFHASTDWETWKAFIAQCGVPEVRLHDARHTAATLLLLMGVDGRIVMEMMGWSSVTMLKRYQHVLEEMKIEAAKRVEQALWEAPRPTEPDAAVVSLDAFRRKRNA
uniref:tyrosine-type recombinase/integrase n=1 Tax=Arthrobacter silvisoli TaxID=2291022 RepID=UPI001B346ACC